MKSLLVVPRTVLLRSAVCALAAVLSVTATFAENVPLTLTLITPADPNTNRLDVDFTIAVPSVPFSQTQSTQTDLSGMVTGNADIDFAPGTHEATVNSIAFGIPGPLNYTDMTVIFTGIPVVNAIQLDTAGLTGFLNTPGSPSTVTTGDFPAGDHEAVLIGGTVTPTPPVHAPIDFSSDPLMEMLAAGIANIDVTKGGLLGLVQTYDVTLTVPFAFTSSNDVILGNVLPATETVDLSGTIVATGSFVHTIPEPTSIMLSLIGAVLAIFLVRRM